MILKRIKLFEWKKDLTKDELFKEDRLEKLIFIFIAFGFVSTFVGIAQKFAI